jgi:DNA-binding GntR family transcriptional regulator
MSCVQTGDPPLSERAYQAIRELIVSLELAPGAVLDERALTARLALGRTPVREALRRLALEQLVAVYPRRGMFVTDVDVRDLARISEVRALLEPAAARLAAERRTEDEAAGLRVLVRELDRPGDDQRALMALDERIHRAVYRAAHNHLLEKTLGEYYVLALRIWMIALDRQEELGGAVEQHRTLLEAVLDADADAAEEAVRGHVEAFEQAMRKVLVAL